MATAFLGRIFILVYHIIYLLLYFSYYLFNTFTNYLSEPLKSYVCWKLLLFSYQFFAGRCLTFYMAMKTSILSCGQACVSICSTIGKLTILFPGYFSTVSYLF